MEIAEALAYAKPIGKGALVTLKADGRPKISNIMFSVGDDGLVRTSVTESRQDYEHAARPEGLIARYGA